MSEEMKKKEEAVFEEEVNDEELRQTVGGLFFDFDEDKTHCTNFHFRDIYDGNFPNCAATVESGSHCWTNDACDKNAVSYTNMKGCFLFSCTKAWE